MGAPRTTARVQRPSPPIGTYTKTDELRPVGGAPLSRARKNVTSGRPRENIEDFRAKLEQVKRETREIKAMESQLKWSMKREEDKTRRIAKNEEKAEIMAWRDEQRRATNGYFEVQRKEQEATYLRDSKDYQETKREARAAHKEEELGKIRDTYIEGLENSEWNVELKKATMAHQRQVVVEDNLERYRLVAEHNLELQQQEQFEETESRIARETADMNARMELARVDRDKALAALEHLRRNQHLPVTSHHHLMSRPQGASERLG